MMTITDSIWIRTLTIAPSYHAAHQHGALGNDAVAPGVRVLASSEWPEWRVPPTCVPGPRPGPVLSTAGGTRATWQAASGAPAVEHQAVEHQGLYGIPGVTG